MSSVRKSINEPAFQVLFQPVPASERTSLQSRIEAVPKAWGNVLPGLLLLGLTSLSFITPVHLSYLFLVILIFWVLACLRMQGEYRNILSSVVARTGAYLRKVGITPDSASAQTAPSSRQSFEAMVRLAGAEQPESRVRAAVELGQSGRHAAYAHVLTLLRDEHPSVRAAALRAAGELRKPELWPHLLEHLANEQDQDAAAAALLATGQTVMPALSRFFNQASQPLAVRLRLVGIASDIGGEAALRFLRTQINHPIQAVRSAVFAGLSRLHHRATVTERPHLLRQLDEQVALLVWLMAARLDLAPYPREAAMLAALHQEERAVIPRIFNLLATLYGDSQFELIRELILDENDPEKGYLTELLMATLPAEMKDKVLPLFAGGTLAERLRNCALNYPQQRLAVEARLHDIINKDFSKIAASTKVIALGELLDWHQTDPTTILVASAASPDEQIAETAMSVLKTLNPSRFAALHQALQRQPGSVQARLADRVAEGTPLGQSTEASTF